jgi:hypothetical protein
LGVSSTSELYKALDVELKWALRRCPVRYLARAIEIFSGMEKAKRNANEDVKEEAKEIMVAAVETLQRRWVEVTFGSDFISVFKVIGFLNDETRTKIEDRAVEMVQGFSPPEMRKVGWFTVGLAKLIKTPTSQNFKFVFFGL